MMQQKQRVVGRFVGLLLVLFGFAVWGQTQSLTVTSYSDAVRFAAQGSVKELRVEILSLAGQKVFDSGSVSSGVLDWKMLNSEGQPVASGVYLYSVTVKDEFGNITKRLGKLALVRGKPGAVAPPLTLLSGPTVGEVAQNPRLQPLGGPDFGTGSTIVGGTLGLGTASPTESIHVFSSGNTPKIRLVSDINTTFATGTFYYRGRNDANAEVEYARLSYQQRGTVAGAERGAFFLGVMAGGTFNSEALLVEAPVKTEVRFGMRGLTASNALSEIASLRAVMDIDTDGNESGSYRFWTRNAGILGERMRLTSSGNVGIGTTNPTARTHINNTSSQPGLRIDSSAGTNALEIYNTEGGANLVFRVERTTGNVYADGSITGGGADVAERIDTTEALEAGDVVEIDSENPGKFRKAREAVSTRVAGVISTTPGVVLGNEKQLDGGMDARPILALAGRVPVKVTAKYGTISIGDLLVSSPIPGYAMKCPEASQCIGAVIGKALEPLKEGVGKIEAQVMLR